MLDYPAIAQKLSDTMATNGDSARELARRWGISAMTIVNARRGKTLSAEVLCQICLYTGDNPLVFWREPGLSYDQMGSGMSIGSR